MQDVCQRPGRRRGKRRLVERVDGLLHEVEREIERAVDLRVRLRAPRLGLLLVVLLHLELGQGLVVREALGRDGTVGPLVRKRIRAPRLLVVLELLAHVGHGETVVHELILALVVLLRLLEERGGVVHVRLEVVVRLLGELQGLQDAAQARVNCLHVLLAVLDVALRREKHLGLIVDQTLEDLGVARGHLAAIFDVFGQASDLEPELAKLLLHSVLRLKAFALDDPRLLVRLGVEAAQLE